LVPKKRRRLGRVESNDDRRLEGAGGVTKGGSVDVKAAEPEDVELELGCLGLRKAGAARSFTSRRAGADIDLTLRNAQGVGRAGSMRQKMSAWVRRNLSSRGDGAAVRTAALPGDISCHGRRRGGFGW
jgi:hypothetical protein